MYYFKKIRHARSLIYRFYNSIIILVKRIINKSNGPIYSLLIFIITIRINFYYFIPVCVLVYIVFIFLVVFVAFSLLLILLLFLLYL